MPHSVSLTVPPTAELNAAPQQCTSITVKWQVMNCKGPDVGFLANGLTCSSYLPGASLQVFARQIDIWDRAGLCNCSSKQAVVRVRLSQLVFKEALAQGVHPRSWDSSLDNIRHLQDPDKSLDILYVPL